MRGLDERTGSLFSYVDLEDRVPAKHPLRVIRRVVNDVLSRLDGEFANLYADGGRPSIPPERLLRALLLQAFYSIRSETQLMEQLDYNLLYRWFVGLGVDEPVWVQTVFTKNRDRLLEAEVAHKFLAELLNHKEVRGLLSNEHFSVDGTQIAAWASMKSFRAKDGSDEPPGGGNVTPHIAQNTSNRTSAIDGRTTRHPGYEISQQKRKRIEEPFGWAKTIGGLARPMLHGAARMRFKFTLTMAAYNLVRLPKLLNSPA
jgi:transposase